MSRPPRFPDETLMAYVDHELDAAASREIETAMQGDAELAARVARQRALRGLVHGAFDAVLDEPVPERLRAALRGETATSPAAMPAAAPPAPADTGDVVPMAAAPRRRGAVARWGQWGALAASLLVGVWLGRNYLAAPADASWARAEDGQLVARAELAQALTSQLASAQADDARVRVGVSFVSRTGDYCRSFTMADGLAGLACKPGAGGDWRLPLLVQHTGASGPQGAYRQAASNTPLAVLRAIDEQIDGTPLDAAAERDAVQHGWQRSR